VTTPCQCPAAGWCETHKRQMSEVRHRQCRDEPGYYEAFAKGAGSRPLRGLGDAVAAVTEATGIAAAVKAVSKALGKDCGCGKRRQALNERFPFGPPAPG
jgi:hypothetical protein